MKKKYFGNITARLFNSVPFLHCQFVCLMPHLVEVRIGSDAPPNMRASNQRLRPVSSSASGGQTAEEVQEEALKEIVRLKGLKTLVLKDYGTVEVMLIKQIQI